MLFTPSFVLKSLLTHLFLKANGPFPFPFGGSDYSTMSKAFKENDRKLSQGNHMKCSECDTKNLPEYFKYSKKNIQSSTCLLIFSNPTYY